MKKTFKNILLTLISISILFNFSYSEFGDDFELDCPSCNTPEPVYENPVYEDPVYDNPVYDDPVYTNPIYDEPVYNDPIYNDPVYTDPVDITYRDGGGYYYTPSPAPKNNNNAPIYTGGPVYSTPPKYNTPSPLPVLTPSPTYKVPTVNWGGGISWGGGNGYTQTYGPSPTYIAPTAPRIVCPVNYNVEGQGCVPHKKSCTDGRQVSFFEVCTKICWGGQANGQSIPENQACPSGTNTTGGSVRQTYVNTITYNDDNSYLNITTKTCKNGIVVNKYDICTKICNDGSKINEGYECPAIKIDHSVVTTGVNQLTTSSAVCNGLANIKNRVNSNGYFEYGTTGNLGNVTNKGNLGGDSSISFSNTISNLQPNTKYYCRAVMSNVDGVYKGDIVSFKTSSEVKRYVSTVREEQVTKIQTVNKTAIKKTAVKTVVTCKDQEGNTEELKDGEKLLDLSIENTSGFLAAGQTSDYVITYKNKSKLSLSDLIVKVKVPEGLAILSSDVGDVDTGEIVFEKAKLKAGEEGNIKIKLKASRDLNVGKTLIISSNASYDVLDENGEVISDESNAYIISTVTNKEVSSEASTEDVSFWSGWLFKFLLLLVLFVILFILGRNIYKKIVSRRHSNQVLGHH